MKSAVIALLLFGATVISAQQSSLWTWVCDENKTCQRRMKADVAGTPMNVCKLNCGDYGSLWPKPTGKLVLGKELVSLYPSNITFTNIDTNPIAIREMLHTSSAIFENYIEKMHSKPIAETGDALKHQLSIGITVATDTTSLTYSTNESYSLNVVSSTTGDITTVLATIDAETFFGARHALETLSQLITYDEVNDVLQMVSEASITDAPVFKHRGMMLDTSRNYFSIGKLKRLIDGLSYNKLNVFHWHITDSYAFPMQTESLPQMIEYGAYSPEKIYTKEVIVDLVNYGKQRGVKIIPELDQPAHSGYGYQWGAAQGRGNLVVCVENEPWYDFCVQPPCGQLNVANPNVTDVVGTIFKDMLGMFDNDVFHMGGDEVDFRCYNTTKEITDWMLANGYTLETEEFFRLWGEFQEKLLKKLLEASNTQDTQVFLWTSGLTHPDRIEKYLDKNRYILQIWSTDEDPAIGGILEKGYKAIFSNVNALYLDCGFPAWLGGGHNWCAPIKGWQTMYDNDPEKIYASFTNETAAEEAVKSGQIVGGETPLWAEQTDDEALESRVWPRAAAHAERLWSHPKTGFLEAEIRMVTNRNRLVERGLGADRLQPEFCLQFEGKCYAEKVNTKNGGATYLPSFITFLIVSVAYFL